MNRRFLYAILTVASSWPVASAWCQPIVERVPRYPLGFRLIKTAGVPRGVPRGGTGAADQFLLAEALAARGVIVVSGQPLGSVPDGTAADDFMDLLKESAGRALDAGLALPGVDSSRVIAFDVTGSTALMMQIERPRFAAAVAFDEMPFSDRHRTALERSAANLRLRVLHFPLGAPAPNAALFSKLPRVTSVEIPGATHGLMSAWGTFFKRQLHGDTRLYDTALSRILAFIDSVKGP